MNFLTVLRDRIIRDFPEISDLELEIRLKLAYEILKNVRK